MTELTDLLAYIDAHRTALVSEQTTAQAQISDLNAQVLALQEALRNAGAPETPPAPTPTTLPGVVRNVGYSGLSSTLVTLTWQAPADLGTGTLDRYEVRDDLSGMTKQPTPGTSLSLTWTNLSPASIYDFKVRAVTTHGPGDWTLIRVTTPSNVVIPPPEPIVELPGPVDTLTASPQSSTSLKITYTAPVNMGTGALDRYEIRNAATLVTVSPSPATALTHTITGLTALASYTYRVRAVTTAGAGPWADVSVTMPSGTVTPPPPNPNPNPEEPADMTPNRYVSLTGADTNPGTVAAPWKTIKYAMSQLVAGDILLVKAGLYDQGTIDPVLKAGTSTSPITIMGETGARVSGLVRLNNPTYWVWDNIDVSWKTGIAASEHMFRITGGNGWQVLRSTMWGSRSFAVMNVAGAPTNWRIAGNYFYDALPANAANQDHCLSFTGSPSAGIIERNIFRNSPNGRGIKLGATGQTATGVVIRYNTFIDNFGPSNLELTFVCNNTQIHRNIFVGSNKQNISQWSMTGTGNVAYENIGWAAVGGVVDTSNAGLKDTGGNVIRNPLLDSGYYPTDTGSLAYGHRAGQTRPPVVELPMLIGGAYGGNDDPTPLETEAGCNFQIRRTYFQDTGLTGAINVCNADKAKGRIPYISFKFPGTWVQVRTGVYDAWAQNIANQLNALNQVIYIAFHHEPNGDEPDILDWKAAQQRIAPFFDVGKLKYTVSYTGYPELNDPEFAFSRTWPGGKVKALYVDIYQRYGTTDAGLAWTPIDTFYGKVNQFAKSVNVPWGLSETGVTDEAQAADPQALAKHIALAKKHEAEAFCYFDSILNSKGSWRLTGTKKAQFIAALRSARGL